MKISILLLGIVIIIVGILFSKSDHEKFLIGYESSSASVNENIMGAALYFLLGLILSISPWYTFKILLMGLGIFFMSLSIFYM